MIILHNSNPKEGFIFMKKARWIALLCVIALVATLFAGCGANGDDRRIIRIGHNQSTTHPTHIGLTAFADYINEQLGDKYKVEVYPSELLGSQTEMVQLTQTGAIDIVVASNSIMETFSKNYSLRKIFMSISFLFPPNLCPDNFFKRKTCYNIVSV